VTDLGLAAARRADAGAGDGDDAEGDARPLDASNDARQVRATELVNREPDARREVG